MKQPEIPIYEQPLNDNLSLCELIQKLNADRAVMREARVHSPLLWKDIAGQDDEGNIVFWRDVPMGERPPDKRGL